MKAMKHNLLQILLLAGAIGWGISLLGILLPWPIIDTLLQNMGAASPMTDPQMKYWFRMATGGWSVIGFLYLWAFLHPEKYRNMIVPLAVATLFEGGILLVHGLLLHIPAFPFAGDVVFCLIVGCGLLCCSRRKAACSYPLLAGRTANASAWKLPNVDPAITAAFLEVIAFAFCLNTEEELFLLRPEDSLLNLYNSYYHGSILNSDNMELEECCSAFERLCRYSGETFPTEIPIRDLLTIIAQKRGNTPPTTEEQKSLRISMMFLSYLENKAI